MEMMALLVMIQPIGRGICRPSLFRSGRQRQDFQDKGENSVDGLAYQTVERLHCHRPSCSGGGYDLSQMKPRAKELCLVVGRYPESFTACTRTV